jgi:nickel superoxide dismutase
MKSILVLALSLLALGAALEPALAHCQVPCGIYDDAARIARLQEDKATIEKAMAQVNALAGQTDAQSLNQLARWIDTKEQHADNIIEIVSQYFLTQKVKPADAANEAAHSAYLESLRDHHIVMVMAMKCKQNADPSIAILLGQAIDDLAAHYVAD